MVGWGCAVKSGYLSKETSDTADDTARSTLRIIGGNIKNVPVNPQRRIRLCEPEVELKLAHE